MIGTAKASFDRLRLATTLAECHDAETEARLVLAASDLVGDVGELEVAVSEPTSNAFARRRR